MNIIFDLDGTLIDSSERLYRLFQYLVPESNLTKEEYWDLKRDKVNHEMIINKFFQNTDYEEFNDRWMKLIETEEYVKLDKKYSDTLDTLENLSTEHTLILLTARQSKKNLMDELRRLEIKKYFEKILVTEGLKSKSSLLNEELKRGNILQNVNDLFVSDMGKDILVGKEFSFLTVGITHGFMCRERLKEYSPNYIIDELKELGKIVADS